MSDETILFSIWARSDYGMGDLAHHERIKPLIIKNKRVRVRARSHRLKSDLARYDLEKDTYEENCGYHSSFGIPLRSRWLLVLSLSACRGALARYGG